MSTPINDPSSERSVLSFIFKNSKEGFIRCSDYISSEDFSVPQNRQLYQIFSKLYDDESCEGFDNTVVLAKARDLGIHKFFESNDGSEYLDIIQSSYVNPENIDLLCLQVRKYSVMRRMHKTYSDVANFIESAGTDEPLSKIIAKAESSVTDFISKIDAHEQKDNSLFDNLDEYIEAKINQPICTQVGISTGFPLFDTGIGGGIRPGTVNVIGARAKRGKSWLSLNQARNIALQGIPVLYLDTELTKEYQQDRLISIDSGCPITLLETNQFRQDNNLMQAVMESAKRQKELPISYECVGGQSIQEILTKARHWLVKKVGFNQDGTAKPCSIFFDYLKLMNAEGVAKHTPEYMLLGFMITELHNFAVKYRLPIVTMIQLNRDGIDSDASNVIAGSDRILWLCSSFTILKDKDENDISMGCGWNLGNKKMIIVDTRQGPGMEVYGDYVNVHASMRPNVAKENATGLMTEGFLFSQTVNTNGS